MPTPHSRTYSWSPGGLLNLTQDEAGHRTDYLYDATGQLIGIWAPNYDYLAFSHDAGGRLTEKWFPNGTTARYNYNADDSLNSLTNRSAANSVLTSHVYCYKFDYRCAVQIVQIPNQWRGLLEVLNFTIGKVPMTLPGNRQAAPEWCKRLRISCYIVGKCKLDPINVTHCLKYTVVITVFFTKYF